MKSQTEPRVVVIGGGTGSFTLLSQFKNYFGNLTALVNMVDDGGSTGVLRDELGVLPPGDIRQCLVALSSSPKLRDLFEYRFHEGGLEGHSFGNIFLSAVEKMTGNFSEAVAQASEILRIQGRVLPITTTDTHLVVRQSDGEEIRGEYLIAHMPIVGEKPQLKLAPAASITPQARQAVQAADIIVIAPGNLYGSLAPVLLVDGVREALQNSPARLIYVCNLVTKPGQTDKFSVEDYVSEIERFIGAPLLDTVIYNTDRPSDNVLQRYIHEGEMLVPYDEKRLETQHYRAIGLPLIAKGRVSRKTGDPIAATRSLIRHDAVALAETLLKIFNHEA